MLQKKKFLSFMLSLALVFTSFIPGVSFAADPVTVDILTINDFHGSLQESGKNVGMAKMVAAYKAAKSANPNTIVVSSGDNYQGSAMSNLKYGEPVSDLFKLLDLKLSAVGNHEFDWGTDKIPTFATQGGLTFLASNIYDKTTNKPVTWAKPYVIQEIGGKKIAFIGLTTLETAYKTKAVNVANLLFKDPAESAKVWVDYLKSGKDAAGIPDAIVALTHIPVSQDSKGVITGDEVQKIAAVTGINAIVGAHNHATVAGAIGDVAVVEAYYNGRAFGKLSFNFTDNTVSVKATMDELHKRTKDIVPDPEALAVYDKWNKELSPILGKVLGKATGALTHDKTKDTVSVLGQYVSKVMAEKAGTQIAIQNGGGLRRDIPAGDITYGILYEVMPFDNTLVKMKLKGSDLYKNIEYGLSNTTVGKASFYGLIAEVDTARRYDQLIKLSLADGTPIDKNAYYTVCINDFMYPKGDNFDFSGAIEVVDTFEPIRDTLVSDVQTSKSIAATPVNGVVDYDIYVIQKGDTLKKIADTFKTTVQKLGNINKMKNKYELYSGHVLLVPSGK